MTEGSSEMLQFVMVFIVYVSLQVKKTHLSVFVHTALVALNTMKCIHGHFYVNK